ncbi:MAG: efflux RND transporter periplasmic adaptor subunit, partial [Gammaproteobacteria bacterium]|nr:efflux RND transporter periplasmic adaptor subunit [Gammaproteobacteria bacterium]
VRHYLAEKFIENFKPPAVTVSTTPVVLKTWHPELHAVGTLKAINGVEVSPELAGQIREIYFSSGQIVKMAQPLIQIDDDLDRQQLKNDMAQMQLNKVNYQRQLQLYETRATPKSSLDDAAAKLVQSQAAVEADRVRIAKKLIKAPFAGKLGIRNVNLGQYVKPGDNLVPLQQLNPLHCDFTLPEQDLKFLAVGLPINIKVEAYPGELFNGKLTGVNSLINVNTRTVVARATIPNTDNRLYPGVFADVDVVLPVLNNVITIPQTAITYSLYGDTAYVVTESGKDKKGQPILMAKQRFIQVGERRGNVAQILKGLKPGEIVVTAGQLKLQNDTEIKINNTVKIQ